MEMNIGGYVSMRDRIYFILYDADVKGYDIAGPIYDDTKYTMMVADAANKGINIHCSTVWEKDVKSVDDLKKDNDPEGYRYIDGLFEKHGICV